MDKAKNLHMCNINKHTYVHTQSHLGEWAVSLFCFNFPAKQCLLPASFLSLIYSVVYLHMYLENCYVLISK